MDNNAIVKCLHPQVILHPYAKSYFIRYGLFCMNGTRYYDFVNANRYQRNSSYDYFIKHFVSSFYQKYKSNPTATFDHDSLLNNYHFFDSDGNIYPMFLLVPCGKCSICNNSRLNDLSARCALETYSSKCKPLFVTLTYDNEHLPADGSVSLDDIQKFLKRLRINLNRFFSTVDENGKRHDAKISIRYLYSSEYTPNTERPHYHLLLWNVPYLPSSLSEFQKSFLDSRTEGYPDSETTYGIRPFDCAFNRVVGGSRICDLGRIRGYDVLKKFIWASWKKGFIKVEVSRDPSGRYVAKYIGKGSKTPKGRTAPFVRWSTRRGLGFDAFDSTFKAILIENPKLTELTFMDPKFGRLTKIPVPKYYRSLLAPALSVVGKPFIENLKLFHHLYCCAQYKARKLKLWADFDLKVLHRKVCQKFELWIDSCGLSIPVNDKLHDRVVSYELNRMVKCYDNAYAIQRCVCNGARSLALWLLDYDLDSLHVQDIIQWKIDHSFAVQEFANREKHPLSYYYDKAKQTFDKFDRIARSRDCV